MRTTSGRSATVLARRLDRALRLQSPATSRRASTTTVLSKIALTPGWERRVSLAVDELMSQPMATIARPDVVLTELENVWRTWRSASTEYESRSRGETEPTRS